MDTEVTILCFSLKNSNPLSRDKVGISDYFNNLNTNLDMLPPDIFSLTIVKDGYDIFLMNFHEKQIYFSQPFLRLLSPYHLIVLQKWCMDHHFKSMSFSENLGQ